MEDNTFSFLNCRGHDLQERRLSCCQQQESKRPGQLLYNIFTYWLTSQLKRIWICKFFFSYKLQNTEFFFCLFYLNFLTLNFGFLFVKTHGIFPFQSGLVLNSFNLDFSFHLLDCTVCFATQKKNIPTLSLNLLSMIHMHKKIEHKCFLLYFFCFLIL